MLPCNLQRGHQFSGTQRRITRGVRSRSLALPSTRYSVIRFAKKQRVMLAHVSITLSVYLHVMPDMQRDAAQVMDRLFAKEE
jgi:hypothetical protein